MRDKKRRLETFSFYDFTGIAAHLTKMAEKGWLLEKMSNFGWTYRRIEPKKLTFSVCYYPKASEFDPEPSEEQRIFHEFCEHTGWVLAAASAQMQVFYIEREDPTPIETDPVLEIETLHASAKRNFIPAYILLLLLGVWSCVLFWQWFLRDFVGTLASPTNLFSGICWIAVFFLCLMELTTYYAWRAKAKKAAVLGALPASPSREKIQKLILFFVVLVFIYWQLSVFIVGSKLFRVLSVLMLAYLVVLFAVANGVKTLLKKLRASKGVNRTVTTVTTLLVSFGIMGGITYGTLRAAREDWFGGAEEYMDLPLTVEDLMDVSYDGYIKARTGDESLLASRFNMRQHPRAGSEHAREMPSLEYTIVEVKLPSLYGLCKQSLLNERSDEWENGQVVFYDHYESIDPTPWRAQEVYQVYWSSGNYLDHYLLCYERRIVEITFFWEPTPEQMAIVADRLSGE